MSSIEKKSQETDWKSWRQLGKNKIDTEEVKGENSDILDQLKNALLSICRNDFSRINLVKEDDFLQRINLDKDRFSRIITFQQLKNKAIEELNSIGFGNPENVDLGPGRYVVVGDSHGKYTKKGVFAMLREVNKYLKPNNIIHIGHLLDDDNDISYE